MSLLSSMSYLFHWDCLDNVYNRLHILGHGGVIDAVGDHDLKGAQAKLLRMLQSIRHVIWSKPARSL